MTSEILTLIETVDPSDIAKMDEIDARTWCWLNDDTHEFVGRGKHGFEYAYADPNHDLESGIYNTQAKPYSRSRDALKSIRPEGWRWSFDIPDCCNFSVDVTAEKPLGNKLAGWEKRIEVGGKTEELAELHVIIQAIEYERNK